MKNKAQGAVVYTLKDGRPVTDLPMFSSQSGEMNAYNRADAFAQQRSFMEMVQRGDVVASTSSAEDPSIASMSAAERTEARNQLFLEAMQDSTGQKWASLGSSIIARIENHAERAALFNNVLVGAPLRQGEMPRVELKQNVCHGIVATSASDMGYQVMRGKVFNPTEFEIKSNVRVPRIDIHQIAGDLMERAQRDAQQALVTTKDRLLIEAFDQTVGRGNPQTLIYGKLSPDHLARQRDSIESWNIPVSATILSSDFWTDMITSQDWQNALEPVTRYELMMTGRMATLLGMDMITDGFRDPTQRVLRRGSMYTIASPEYLGAFTNRGAMVEATTGANEGSTDKGWLVAEIMSFIIAQCRCVAMAQRK